MDWSALIQHCFDNREADIGAFVRRHLTGIDLGNLGELLRTEPLQSTVPTPPTSSNRLLAEGYASFQQRAKDRGRTTPERMGTIEAAVVIDGNFAPIELSQAALWRLKASVPRQSVWPPWAILLNGDNDQVKPYVLNDAWESFVDFPGSDMFPAVLDFWRIDTRGQFYLLRELFDDIPFKDHRPKPNTALDFAMQIKLVAEIISVAFAFAHAIGCEPKHAQLAFALRWRHLSGRVLWSWSEPSRGFVSAQKSVQDELTTTIIVPLETPTRDFAASRETSPPGFRAFRRYGVRYASLRANRSSNCRKEYLSSRSELRTCSISLRH
jgi:hypothetical protein